MNISPHTSARYGMHEEGMNLGVSGIYALPVGRPMYDKLEKFFVEEANDLMNIFENLDSSVKSKVNTRTARLVY
jgi:hypothetical protein